MDSLTETKLKPEVKGKSTGSDKSKSRKPRSRKPRGDGESAPLSSDKGSTKRKESKRPAKSGPSKSDTAVKESVVELAAREDEAYLSVVHGVSTARRCKWEDPRHRPSVEPGRAYCYDVCQFNHEFGHVEFLKRREPVGLASSWVYDGPNNERLPLVVKDDLTLDQLKRVCSLLNYKPRLTKGIDMNTFSAGMRKTAHPISWMIHCYAMCSLIAKLNTKFPYDLKEIHPVAFILVGSKRAVTTDLFDYSNGKTFQRPVLVVDRNDVGTADCHYEGDVLDFVNECAINNYGREHAFFFVFDHSIEWMCHDELGETLAYLTSLKFSDGQSKCAGIAALTHSPAAYLKGQFPIHGDPEILITTQTVSEVDGYGVYHDRRKATFSHAEDRTVHYEHYCHDTINHKNYHSSSFGNFGFESWVSVGGLVAYSVKMRGPPALPATMIGAASARIPAQFQDYTIGDETFQICTGVFLTVLDQLNQMKEYTVNEVQTRVSTSMMNYEGWPNRISEWPTIQANHVKAIMHAATEAKRKAADAPTKAIENTVLANRIKDEVVVSGGIEFIFNLVFGAASLVYPMIGTVSLVSDTILAAVKRSFPTQYNQVDLLVTQSLPKPIANRFVFKASRYIGLLGASIRFAVRALPQLRPPTASAFAYHKVVATHLKIPEVVSNVVVAPILEEALRARIPMFTPVIITLELIQDSFRFMRVHPGVTFNLSGTFTDFLWSWFQMYRQFDRVDWLQCLCRMAHFVFENEHKREGGGYTAAVLAHSYWNLVACMLREPNVRAQFSSESHGLVKDLAEAMQPCMLGAVLPIAGEMSSLLTAFRTTSGRILCGWGGVEEPNFGLIEPLPEPRIYDDVCPVTPYENAFNPEWSITPKHNGEGIQTRCTKRHDHSFTLVYGPEHPHRRVCKFTNCACTLAHALLSRVARVQEFEPNDGLIYKSALDLLSLAYHGDPEYIGGVMKYLGNTICHNSPCDLQPLTLVGPMESVEEYINGFKPARRSQLKRALAQMHIEPFNPTKRKHTSYVPFVKDEFYQLNIDYCSSVTNLNGSTVGLRPRMICTMSMQMQLYTAMLSKALPECLKHMCAVLSERLHPAKIVYTCGMDALEVGNLIAERSLGSPDVGYFAKIDAKSMESSWRRACQVSFTWFLRVAGIGEDVIYNLKFLTESMMIRSFEFTAVGTPSLGSGAYYTGVGNSFHSIRSTVAAMLQFKAVKGYFPPVTVAVNGDDNNHSYGLDMSFVDIRDFLEMNVDHCRQCGFTSTGALVQGLYRTEYCSSIVRGVLVDGKVNHLLTPKPGRVLLRGFSVPSTRIKLRRTARKEIRDRLAHAYLRSKLISIDDLCGSVSFIRDYSAIFKARLGPGPTIDQVMRGVEIDRPYSYTAAKQKYDFDPILDRDANASRYGFGDITLTDDAVFRRQTLEMYKLFHVIDVDNSKEDPFAILEIDGYVRSFPYDDKPPVPVDVVDRSFKLCCRDYPVKVTDSVIETWLRS